MVCVRVAAVGAAMLMVTIGAAVPMAAVSATVIVVACAVPVGRMMAVAGDWRQPQDGCRHGDGQDGF
jgi:hypothetical protein